MEIADDQDINIDNNDLFAILDFPSSMQNEQVPPHTYEQKLCTLQKILLDEKNLALSAARKQRPAPISNYLLDSYHVQELECAFQYIACKQISFGLEFNSYRTIENFKEALSTLKSIAHQLGVEYKLKAIVFEVSSMSLFEFNVKTSSKLLDYASSLYCEAKATNKDTAALISGHDALLRISIDKAFLAFLKADFKSAASFWKGARNIGARTYSKPLFIVPFCIFKTLLDSPLTKAEADALAEFSTDISLAPFRFFINAFIGMSLAKEGFVKQAIYLVHEAVKAGIERYGSIFEQILACGVLRVYIDGKMYREAISYADAVVHKSNVLKLQDVGLFEVYRYKAIALFRLLQESESSLDNVQVYLIVGEILKVLQEALQQISGRECLLLELKLTIVLAEVLQKYGNRAQKAEVLEKLNSYLENIVYEDSLCCGSEELKKANRILAELSSLVMR